MMLNPRIRYQDFRYHLGHLHKMFVKLPESTKAKIRDLSYQSFTKEFTETDFRKAVSKFVMNFGYLRESGNDFSMPSWIEVPETILTMITMFDSPPSEKYTMQETQDIAENIFNSPISRLMYKKSIKYSEYRETVNLLYMYGYGLFRPYFLKIGEILVSNQKLAEEQDVFYLSYTEIQNLMASDEKISIYKEKISKRKAEMDKYANIHLPEIIYDDNPPEPLSGIECMDELEGVATSRGIYVGPVKVVKSINDYEKIGEGDVIVIPYSDVSWTPLFSKARAVISESGGILSHCSIVAREYKIPAIVSVNGALDLKDNTIVAVDGNTGKISIIRKEQMEDCD